MTDPAEDQELENILEYMRRYRSADFTGYKRASLTRRLQKRMQEVGIATYADYTDYLEVHPEEFKRLFDTMLINVTRFYRDNDAWMFIADTLIPQILAAKHSAEPVRVWCAGVASGEEAYTIAMLLVEALGEHEFAQRVKIYATDLDENALAEARAARYSQRAIDRIPADNLERFFNRAGPDYDFKKELRRAVIFGRHDLTQDAPISRIDLLICRNTLIYFNSETQARVLARFHFALNEEGYLFLGKAEMMLAQSTLFRPVNLRCRVFAKQPNGTLRKRLQLPFQHDGHTADILSNLAELGNLRAATFEKDLQAQVVINHAGRLVLANKKARRLFPVQLDDLNVSFKDLTLSYQPVDLRSALEQAQRERLPVHLPEVTWQPNDGAEMVLDIRVLPLEDPLGELMGYSIVFSDVTETRQLSDQYEQANHDLKSTLQELQTTNEEMETTKEEMHSINEEMETVNEELHTTIEEQETTNEELQSTNEELETINEELRIRTDELNAANIFLSAILTSLSGGVVVLDQELHIQLWNDQMTELWGLRASEVVGQRFLGLDIGLPLDPIRVPLLSCLELRSAEEILTLEAVNRRGAKILCDITIRPLGHTQERVTGVIMTIEVTNPQ